MTQTRSPSANREAGDALVEVFWRAFQGLTKRQRALFLEKLLANLPPELLEDVEDILHAYVRREEPTRPVEDVLKELERESKDKTKAKQEPKRAVSR